MEHRNTFQNDRKWCPSCAAYVPYLMSIDSSFCAECGDLVRLFSEEDWKAFSESMDARRPKGGRGRKRADRSRRDSA